MVERKRIMLIDAHNQFLRSYIVDPSMSSMGYPIGGAKGFLKILNKLCRLIRPDLLILIWDGQGGSQQRKAKHKEYKAGRKPLRLNRGDVLLTEEEVKKTTTRALKNPEDIPCGDGAGCWPVDCRDSKCSLLQWIMGKCCECGECDD